MDMKKREFLTAGLGVVGGLAAAGTVMAQNAPPAGRGAAPGGGRGAFGRGGRGGPPPVFTGVQPSSVDFNYKPRRLNKVIELWEDNQPIYYTGAGIGPGVDPYAQGVRMARTYADAITVDFEHGAMDFSQLREFMRGLKDGGPTRSGHATPCVFVTSGIIGLDENYARANTWVMTQFLDAGVHGVHICHARDPRAIEVLAQEGCRYPFLDYPNTPRLPRRGLRGSSASFAAQIWGMSGAEYCAKSDLWPLNPNGELIFGVKIEDTIADEHVDQTVAVQGVTFAEYGPGDHSYWLYGLAGMQPGARRAGPPDPNVAEARPEMARVRQAVLDACKRHNVKFLQGDNANNIVAMIQQGAMVNEAPESAAIVGREFTKRKMPV
jgi:4-hydroxy-2-oxoheptanedioate aldolase